MIIKNTYGYAFTPAGTTGKIISKMADNVVDFTSISIEKEFASNDLVYVGVPVYGGRVPYIATEKLLGLRGNNTPAVAVAVYGKREYEDALIELCDTLEKQGFNVIAAGVFLAQHSVVTEIAAGRPDADDLKKAGEFADMVAKKLKGNISDFAEITVPGDRPYKEYKPVSMTMVTGEECILCGACVKNCPVGALEKGECIVTDQSKCINCMKCVNICLKSARSLDSETLKFKTVQLKKLTEHEKEIEIYI